MKKKQICEEIPEIHREIPEINENSKNNEREITPTQTNMNFYQQFSQLQTIPIRLPFPEQFYVQNGFYCVPNAQMNWNINSNYGKSFSDNFALFDDSIESSSVQSSFLMEELGCKQI